MAKTKADLARETFYANIDEFLREFLDPSNTLVGQQRLMTALSTAGLVNLDKSGNIDQVYKDKATGNTALHYLAERLGAPLLFADVKDGDGGEYIIKALHPSVKKNRDQISQERDVIFNGLQAICTNFPSVVNEKEKGSNKTALNFLVSTLLDADNDYKYVLESAGKQFDAKTRIYDGVAELAKNGVDPWTGGLMNRLVGANCYQKSDLFGMAWATDERHYNRRKNILEQIVINTPPKVLLKGVPNGNLAEYALENDKSKHSYTLPMLCEIKASTESKAINIKGALEAVSKKKLPVKQSDLDAMFLMHHVIKTTSKINEGQARQKIVYNPNIKVKTDGGGGAGVYYDDAWGHTHLLKTGSISDLFKEILVPKLAKEYAKNNVAPINTLLPLGNGSVVVDSQFVTKYTPQDKINKLDREIVNQGKKTTEIAAKAPLSEWLDAENGTRAMFVSLWVGNDDLHNNNRGYRDPKVNERNNRLVVTVNADKTKSFSLGVAIIDFGRAFTESPIGIIEHLKSQFGIPEESFLHEGLIKQMLKDSIRAQTNLNTPDSRTIGDVKQSALELKRTFGGVNGWDNLSETKRRELNADLAKNFNGANIDTLADKAIADLKVRALQTKHAALLMQIQLDLLNWKDDIQKNNAANKKQLKQKLAVSISTAAANGAINKDFTDKKRWLSTKDNDHTTEKSLTDLLKAELGDDAAKKVIATAIKAAPVQLPQPPAVASVPQAVPANKALKADSNQRERHKASKVAETQEFKNIRENLQLSTHRENGNQHIAPLQNGNTIAEKTEVLKDAIGTGQLATQKKLVSDIVAEGVPCVFNKERSKMKSDPQIIVWDDPNDKNNPVVYIIDRKGNMEIQHGKDANILVLRGPDVANGISASYVNIQNGKVKEFIDPGNRISKVRELTHEHALGIGRVNNNSVNPRELSGRY
jgi:hypothetical protein